MFWVLALLAGCSGARRSTQTMAPGSGVSVEFRLIDDSAESDAPKMKVKNTLAPWDKEESFHVHSTRLLDQADIAYAEMEFYRDRPLISGMSSGTCYIMIHFTPEGANKLSEITASNVDRRLAIIVDGDLIVAPVIKERITDGQTRLVLKCLEEPARDVVTRINHAASKAASP